MWSAQAPALACASLHATKSQGNNSWSSLDHRTCACRADRSFNGRHRQRSKGDDGAVGRCLAVGYLEQPYTFADRDRNNEILGGRTISISYLGLVREQAAPGGGMPGWHGWYEYLPWEDHRGGQPSMLDDIATRLTAWIGDDAMRRDQRRRRADFTFGLNGAAWNEDLVLQRYELLYEARLVAEAGCDPKHNFGRSMFADHRRILATGMARLRAKIKYRPVVFELMPESFTLLQLQKTVEALAGLTLHKQNFRRLIEQQELVEETGGTESETGGRPAKLFRFRRAVLDEREFAGTKLPLSRN